MRTGAVGKRSESLREEAEQSTASPQATHARVEGEEASWRCSMDLAEGLFHLGQTDEAMRRLSCALQVAGGMGQRDPRVAKTLNALGVMHCRVRNYATAEQLLRRAVSIYEKPAARITPTSALRCSIWAAPVDSSTSSRGPGSTTSGHWRSWKARRGRAAWKSRWHWT